MLIIEILIMMNNNNSILRTDSYNALVEVKESAERC